jgi:23S rRNA (uracil1939-C5)-methyltransferase
MTAAPITLRIEDLGAQGDGIATHEGAKVFVPLTAPGDTITAELSGSRGALADIVSPGPDRVAPRCAHYGVCGGCSLQHLSDPAYLAFKHRQVVDALAAQRIEVPIDPVRSVPPRSRRRAAFAAGRQPKLVLGFHGRRSHQIVPITDCAVITPGMLALLPKLERLAGIACPPKDALTLTVTETLTGFDVALTGVKKGYSADDRLRLIEAASASSLARLSVNGEVILTRTAPAIRAGAAFVTPPPGGFLQASETSEAMMVQLVLETVGDARRVADLFAGAGTFALPLAAKATVHAVEGDQSALDALDAAARRAQGLRPVTVEKRDLFRRPLMPADLKRFDAVVIDPPRAGAEDQAKQLAASNVKRIAMVSCNLQTFARDARILIDGGYYIDRITPIDQFLYSPHIEIVASLSK